jgi:hypothetical protein
MSECGRVDIRKPVRLGVKNLFVLVIQKKFSKCDFGFENRDNAIPENRNDDSYDASDQSADHYDRVCDISTLTNLRCTKYTN